MVKCSEAHRLEVEALHNLIQAKKLCPTKKVSTVQVINFGPPSFEISGCATGHERGAGENVTKFNDLPRSFLCGNHFESKFIYRTICNVCFNNAQKFVNSQMRREVVQQFKESQRKRRYT